MTKETEHSRLVGAHRAVNISLLAGATYGLILPFLAQRLAILMPSLFGSCASLRIFGMPCPLCGLTRGIGAIIMRGDVIAATTLNVLSVPVLVLILCEVVYRIAALCVASSHHQLKRVVNTDCRVHLALLASYLVYAAAFVAGQLRA